MPLLLEAFDAPPAPPAPPGPSPDWLLGQAAGFAEGHALGLAEAAADSTHLSRELAQSLGDMVFSYAEARAQVLGSLRPLFLLLMDRLLPAVAAEALGPWVAEALAEAAAGDSAAPLEIALHPDRLEAVRTCLPPGLPAAIRGDPTLGPDAARLSAPGRESDLDLDSCLASLREAIAALLQPEGALTRHG